MSADGTALREASYRYRAANSAGEVVEGVVAAASQQGALDELRRKHLFPVELAAMVSTGKGVGGALGRPTAVALFARTLATLLGAGLSLERALAFASDQARHPEVAAAGRSVVSQVQSGARLGAALAEHPRVFSPLFSALVAAGEESGGLEDALARVADQLDESVELRGQIRSALIYPAIMAVASAAGVTVLLLFVVPRFVALLAEEGGRLPVSTQLLVAASAVVARGWWILFLLTALAIGGARRWLARPENRRRWHAWRLTWPLVGEIETKYAAARFSRALGMMLRSGGPILPALRTARSTVSNHALGAGLDRAVQEVSQGKRVSAALRETLPPLAAELIAVGEESGRLDELCLKIADTYDTEVRRSLRSLVAVVEPALILAFGLIVGFVALAMLQAIYSVNRSVF